MDVLRQKTLGGSTYKKYRKEFIKEHDYFYLVT